MKRKSIQLLLTISISLLIIGCSKSSKVTSNDLLGRWEVYREVQEFSFMQGRVEYFKGGTWSFTMPKDLEVNGVNSWTGNWSILDDGRIKVDSNINGGGDFSTISDMQFDGEDILLISESDAPVTRYVRTK